MGGCLGEESRYWACLEDKARAAVSVSRSGLVDLAPGLTMAFSTHHLGAEAKGRFLPTIRLQIDYLSQAAGAHPICLKCALCQVANMSIP